MTARRLLAVMVVVLLVAGGLVVAWRLLAREPGMGHVVGRLLTSRTGLPITVAAARTDGSHLTLSDVRLSARPFDIRVSRLDVAGGVMPLLAPAGRVLELVATSASVTVVPAAPGDAAGLDTVRAQLLSLMAWPGVLRLSMQGGELHSDGRVFVFDLTGDKTAGGDVVVALTVAPAGEPRALAVEARVTPAGDGGVTLAVEAAAEPRRLAGLWPAALPPPSALASRGDVRLVRGGDAMASGRITLGAAPSPAVVEGVARWESDTGALVVPRYVLTRAAGLDLEGDAALEPGSHGRMLMATARGTLDGGRVEGRVGYAVATGAFGGEATLHGMTAAGLWRRLEAGVPPDEATVTSARARFTGVDSVGGLTMDVDAVAAGVRLARWPSFPLDGVLKAALRLERGPGGVGLALVERATLDVTRAGVPVAVVTGASRGAALWPIWLDARVADLARLAPVLPFAPVLAGRAQLTGEIERAAFRGDLTADVARATLMLGAPVTLMNVRAAVPVRCGAPEAERRGTLTIGRAAGYGFAADEIASAATLTDGRLVLPDVRYTHYGGRGAGTLEASMQGPLRLSARMEGDGVDLAAVARQSGVTIARVTGRVRYVVSAQETSARGLFVAGRIDGEQGGGEIGIDAIERLLASAAVSGEGTGVLRQTLENLKTFHYDTLATDLRLSGGTGYVDVALTGRKRLGLFPGPVDAIHLNRVPISVLSRTFATGVSP